jgi:hypothetical protein
MLLISVGFVDFFSTILNKIKSYSQICDKMSTEEQPATRMMKKFGFVELCRQTQLLQDCEVKKFPARTKAEMLMMGETMCLNWFESKPLDIESIDMTVSLFAIISLRWFITEVDMELIQGFVAELSSFLQKCNKALSINQMISLSTKAIKHHLKGVDKSKLSFVKQPCELTKMELIKAAARYWFCKSNPLPPSDTHFCSMIMSSFFFTYIDTSCRTCGTTESNSVRRKNKSPKLFKCDECLVTWYCSKNCRDDDLTGLCAHKEHECWSKFVLGREDQLPTLDDLSDRRFIPIAAFTEKEAEARFMQRMRKFVLDETCLRPLAGYEDGLPFGSRVTREIGPKGMFVHVTMHRVIYSNWLRLLGIYYLTVTGLRNVAQGKQIDIEFVSQHFTSPASLTSYNVLDYMTFFIQRIHAIITGDVATDDIQVTADMLLYASYFLCPKIMNEARNDCATRVHLFYRWYSCAHCSKILPQDENVRLTCGRCTWLCYCDDVCQKTHWYTVHRFECKSRPKGQDVPYTIQNTEKRLLNRIKELEATEGECCSINSELARARNSLYYVNYYTSNEEHMQSKSTEHPFIKKL